MRICITSWAPFHAGAEVAAERLALGLQEAGEDVLVVLGTKSETLQRMRSIGLNCEFVPLAMTDRWRFWRHPAAQWRLQKTFRQWQPDIVHFNDLPTSQMVGKAASVLEIPRVCHHRFTFGGTAIDWFNKFGAERHVFISKSLENELCTASARLAEAPRAIVHDGLPLPLLPTAEDQHQARSALGLPQDKVLVLFAGQVVEHKGVADLIRAWHLLPPMVSAEAELVIVGEDFQNDGSYRRAMEQLASQLNCHIRFTGFQRNMAQWQTAADIAVVPSHVEPLGLVVMEAMARARAVIGCNIGGIPEMIVDEETGVLVPRHSPESIANAMQRLISSPQERQRMGRAARERCEKLFSLEAHTKAMLEQYRIVLAGAEKCLAT